MSTESKGAEIVNRFLGSFVHKSFEGKKELLDGIESIKPHISSDFLEVILIHAALNNCGDSDTIVLDGIEVEVDKSITGIILDLNAAGYRTLSSCSGIQSEHTGNNHYVIDGGTISLHKTESSIKRIQGIENELHALGVEINYDTSAYFEPAIMLDFQCASDNELRKKWNDVTRELLRGAESG